MSTNRLPTSVLLATEDRDLGLVHGTKAVSIARVEAHRENKPVYIRHPVSDEVLAAVSPCCGADLSTTHHPYCMKCGASV